MPSARYWHYNSSVFLHCLLASFSWVVCVLSCLVSLRAVHGRHPALTECFLRATFAVLVYIRGRLVQIRGLLIDADDANVGLSQQLLEDSHEDLNSLEECVKR